MLWRRHNIFEKDKLNKRVMTYQPTGENMKNSNDKFVTEVVENLSKIVGKERVTSNLIDLHSYVRDASPLEAPLPMAVVKPLTTEEVSKILKLANEMKFRVFVRGGGTSAGGGGLAFMENSILIDMTAMNKILEISEANMSVTVQTGVIWSTLNKELAKHGYRVPFWGPESAYGATVGGSLALASMSSQGVTEAGGTYNQVITLEVVLPTGEVIRTGSDSLPNGGRFARVCNGGDYAGIFLGSMGVFGVITEATLKLECLPTAQKCIGVVFKKWKQGIDFIYKILRSKTIPKSLNINPGMRAVKSSYGVEGECAFRIILEEMNEKIADIKEQLIRSYAKELGGFFPDGIDEKVKEWWDGMFFRLVKGEKKYGFAAHACHRIPLQKLPIAVKEAEHYFLEVHRVEERGMHFSVGCYVSEQRPACGFYPFLYYRDEPETRKIALEIWEGWIAHAIKAYGACPYWMGIVWSRNLLPNLRPEYVGFLKRLKRALDPNNVLNPGMLV